MLAENAINVNSIEEANQLLEEKWNSLSEQQKLDCIKNDIQNGYNWRNLFQSGGCLSLSINDDQNQYYNQICIDFTDPHIIKPTFSSVNDENYPNVKDRGIMVINLKTINLNSDGTYNFVLNGYQVYQCLLNTDSIVSSQVKMNAIMKISNVNISYKLMKRNNIIFSSLLISPNSNSTIYTKYESLTNWKLNENTPINAFYKNEMEGAIANAYTDIYDNYDLIPSPYLNMLFTINSSN